MGCAHPRMRDSFQLAEQMIRVAFIHNNFPAGGAERITMDIAAYLSTQEGRYESYVYASRIASDKLPSASVKIAIPRRPSTDFTSVSRIYIKSFLAACNSPFSIAISP